MDVPKKPDTSKGFDPKFVLGLDILSPARGAIRLDGALDTSVLSPRIHRFLLDWARLRNVFSSSKMEGNPIPLDEAQRVLQTGKAERPDQEEILRLSKAYARVHETARFQPLTRDEILKIHGELFTGILLAEERPGQFKDKLNGVYDERMGQWVFEATPPERTEVELDALLTWYYGPGQLLDPVVAAGLFFVEFQAIHPFLEGNGRTGRLLNHRLLRASGFQNITLTAIDGMIFRRSRKYYETLRATNRGRNYHVWLRFYADTLRRAYEEAVQRGDLRMVLDGVGTGCERDLLTWVLQSNLDWFQRGDYPNPKKYALITLSTALGSLHERGILERQGEKRTVKYRLSGDFLKGVFERRRG